MVENTITGILIQDNLNRMLANCDKLKDNAMDLQRFIEKIEKTQPKKLKIAKSNTGKDNNKFKQLEALCFKLKNLADEQTRIFRKMGFTNGESTRV